MVQRLVTFSQLEGKTSNRLVWEASEPCHQQDKEGETLEHQPAQLQERPLKDHAVQMQSQESPRSLRDCTPDSSVSNILFRVTLDFQKQQETPRGPPGPHKHHLLVIIMCLNSNTCDSSYRLGNVKPGHRRPCQDQSGPSPSETSVHLGKPHTAKQRVSDDHSPMSGFSLACES